MKERWKAKEERQRGKEGKKKERSVTTKSNNRWIECRV